MSRPLRSIKVTFENGVSFETAMAANLTNGQMLDYYAVGRVFNIGIMNDDMVAVSHAEILK